MLSFLLTSDLLESHRLETAPDGWQSLKYSLERSTEYHGITFTLSSSLTFWKLGGAYLRLLYEGGTDSTGKAIEPQGVEAVAVLTVFERDPNLFTTTEIYRGRIDFTTYRSSENGVEVSLKEMGFSTNIFNRADTAIDLLPSYLGATSLGGVALPPLEPATVTLHSQMLRLRYEATQAGETDLSPGLMFGGDGDASHEQLLYFGFNTPVTNDLGLEPVSGGFVAGEAGDVVPIYTAKENGLFALDLALFAHVEAHAEPGSFPLTYRQFSKVGASCFLRIKGSNGSVTRLQPEIAVGHLDGDYEGEIIVPPRQFSFHLTKGDEIYLYASWFVHELDLTEIDTYRAKITATMKEGSYLRITAESTTAPTPCRGLLVHEVLRRQVEAMTDNSGGFYSEYYGRTDSTPAYMADGPGALRLLTNGFGLRGFPLPIDAVVPSGDGTDPRKPLTASFSTVFGSLNALDCLGAGIEQRHGQPTLRVEHRSFFYQAAETLTLGVVAGLVKSVYTPLLYNAVEVGYQHWQSGSAVGLDEFNGQRAYALPLTQVKATYSLLSEVNGGGYLLEEARRQPYAAGTNKEGQADQELFAIRLHRTPTGLATAKNEAFSSVAGILDQDTAYNLEDAPGRMLRRHGFWLRAGLVPVAGKKLLRTATQGNDKLVSQLLTEASPLDEHADVPIEDLASPLFVAETYEFKVKLRRHQVRRLLKNPYGQIAFRDGQGTRKRGYLLKVECTPDSGEASFTLLRVAS